MSEVKTHHEHTQPEKNLDFNDIVVRLQDHIGVTRDDILHMFKHEIGCSESGKWNQELSLVS